LEEFCRSERIQGHVVEMKREISFWNDIKSLIRLFRLFRKTKPEVIHGSTPKAGLLSMIAGWMNKIPVRIYYIHGLRYQGTKGFKRTLLMFMEKISCYFATDIFAVSHGVKFMLLEDQITQRNVTIIGSGSANGIDVVHFSSQNPTIPDLKSKYNIVETDFVFGFVGRLVRDKGIHELIETFVKINVAQKNTKLVLVGDFEDALDPLDNDIKQIIVAHPNIIFTGFQSDIRPFLKMMNVFVFPSYREGFGVSLMEAAAMDVPAIASDIIGCNEIIKDGYNGILVPAKSLIHLENAMKLVLRNPAILNEMALVSRQFVIDKYERNKLWDKILKSYSELIIYK
ncbi:MAG: glycosyltransferase family 4 protein, partial [Flavobacterium sp.]|nr:glycosyltransferase family 4 protein [Flavobacterium sp.]